MSKTGGMVGREVLQGVVTSLPQKYGVGVLGMILGGGAASWLGSSHNIHFFLRKKLLSSLSKTILEQYVVLRWRDNWGVVFPFFGEVVHFGIGLGTLGRVKS